MSIEWSEPPARTSFPKVRLSKNEKLARELKKHPKRWAKLAVKDKPQTAYVYSNYLKTGQAKGWEPGAFEVVARRMPNGKTGVWARYLGEPRG